MPEVRHSLANKIEMPEPAIATDDPFNLARFVSAQQDSFDRAFSEVKLGRKSSHWMWYIFPQLRGLGHSKTAQFYGITGADEATAYLDHKLLGPRLIAICEAALSVEERSAIEIFGTPDDLKLQSCATLFAHATDTASVFKKIIDKYFDGKADPNTVQLLTDR